MSKSTNAQKAILEQLLERQYVRLEDLSYDDYSYDTARRVLNDLEDDEWVVRKSPRAQTWYLGRGLVNLFWQNSQPVAMPREAIKIYEQREGGDDE